MPGYTEYKYDAVNDTYRGIDCYRTNFYVNTDASLGTICTFGKRPSNPQLMQCARQAVEEVMSKYGFKFKGDSQNTSPLQLEVYHGGYTIGLSKSFERCFGKERGERYYPLIAKQIAERYDELSSVYFEQAKAEAKAKEIAKIQEQNDAWNPEWEAEFEEPQSAANKGGGDGWSMTLTDSTPTITTDRPTIPFAKPTF